MNLLINDVAHDVQSNVVADVLNELSIEKKGVALAINDGVLPRSLWASHELEENDKILIITATAGG